jgi:hypothetical protein
MLFFISTYLCMQKMSPIPSVPIALRIRSARMPVTWTVRESYRPEVLAVDGRVIDKGGVERVFWPQVEGKWDMVEVTEIEDPLDLRVQLFKMYNTNRTEAAALDFLNRVGAWRIVEDGGKQESWAEGTYANVTYRHREILDVRVMPLTLEDLLGDVKHWYKLSGALRNPTKLQAEFKQPPPTSARPYDLSMYALEARFSNTLPVSLEWHGKDPYAVVETITASELMIAAAWSDVLSRAEEQVCANVNCGTRFTWPRKKKYCRWECGHSVAVRNHKRKLADEKRRKKGRKSLR